MTDLVATAVITTSSVALFSYWFRRTCALIVSARTARDYTSQVAGAHLLNFPEITSRLKAQQTDDLDGLRILLDRDYSRLSGLAVRAAVGQDKIEQHMLTLNYQIVRAWSILTGSFSPRAAHQAVEEMASIVAHFANSVGQATVHTCSA
jgi:hypothetical protein